MNNEKSQQAEPINVQGTKERITHLTEYQGIWDRSANSGAANLTCGRDLGQHSR